MANERTHNQMTNLVTKMEYLLKQYSCMKCTRQTKDVERNKAQTKQTEWKQERFDWGIMVGGGEKVRI